MSNKIIYFITGNKNKLVEAIQIIGDIKPFELQSQNID
jgi:hypothetical protein